MSSKPYIGKVRACQWTGDEWAFRESVQGWKEITYDFNNLYRDKGDVFIDGVGW